MERTISAHLADSDGSTGLSVALLLQSESPLTLLLLIPCGSIADTAAAASRSMFTTGVGILPLVAYSVSNAPISSRLSDHGRTIRSGSFNRPLGMECRVMRGVRISSACG